MMTGSNPWVKFTDLQKKNQGPAVVLSLEGEAQEAVLELDESLITSDDGVKHITKILDSQRLTAKEA